ncbi:MAG: DegT/DnrJ/EryC1/StrS aminotransferase, partial [Planctomycetes bacterium]|nr:DegT/DnrJ/EryC1/StrS aminotransferase [Planctomycetota bacterium]
MSNPYKVFEHNVGNILGLEEVKAVLETLEGDSLSWGPARQQFEKEFAAYVGVKHAISTTSCTAALYAATQA